MHLGDGTKPGLPDEHLVPGRGTQPCAELLALAEPTPATTATSCSRSARTGSPTLGDRQADLAESLEFTRRHLAGASRRAPGTRS